MNRLNPLILDGEGNPTSVDRDTIWNLSRTDPTIYAALAIYAKGVLSWEDSMMGLVFLLSKQSRDYAEKYADALRRLPAYPDRKCQ